MLRFRTLLKTMSASVQKTNLAESCVNDSPLIYKVIAECPTTKARVGVITLRHGNVNTPVFMPVGTQVKSA